MHTEALTQSEVELLLAVSAKDLPQIHELYWSLVKCIRFGNCNCQMLVTLQLQAAEGAASLQPEAPMWLQVSSTAVP